jgi:DNA-binding transcriptional ArsR family regulator
MTVDLDAVLEALADPTRRDIFERIVVRPSRVGELAKDLPVTRPAVSHHLRVLRDAGLVHECEGKMEVVVDALPIVRLYFDRLWLEACLGDAWLSKRGGQAA